MALSSALLLLSAVFHASWNALTKRSSDKDAFILGMTLVGGLMTALLIVITNRTWTGLNAPSTWLFTFGAGVFEGFYMLALSRALDKNTLGKAYAIMRGGAMVIVWLISLSFLNESPKSFHILGALVVLLGIIVLSYQQKQTRSQINAWPFLSAVCIAGYHICYHQALASQVDPQILFLISMLMSSSILAMGLGKTAVKRLLDVSKNQGGLIFLTGFLSTASFLIFLYALQIAEPGYAISLRNASIFFALVFSYFLKESLTRQQIIAASIIGIGTILLSLP